MQGATSVVRLLLAALMVGLFAGCDSGEQASKESDEKAVAEKSAEQSEKAKPAEEQAAAPAASQTGEPTKVDHARITNADSEPGNWLSHGRTYSEQRYSPLKQVNTENVKELGLAWYFDMPERRGIEATPLVIDGRMYTTSAWSVVYALNAKTGKELWTYDPEVPKSRGSAACCDAVNRGVAAWGDKVYVGTLDGRLVALDAKTGKEVWDVNTIDPEKPYTITGAPRAVKGKILIGNGGAEYGVRGYVTAYDAETGEQAWRFYTVPGNPADGFEDATQEMAAKTWTGEWWKMGGGGTVWDSITYDPDLDLVYLGVGNGSPWDRDLRSPDGGDNLFLSSIVALKPDTGEYVWHYQTTPGDTWDFTATQHIMLLDLEIDGQMRKVLVQAPKNGFFYVIDRETGKLISANNYVPVNWATKIDLETGRPVEAEGARYPDPDKPHFTLPSAFGGHNWHPMAYSPETGLVYLSAQEIPMIYAKHKNFKYEPGFWNLGIDFAQTSLPEDPEGQKKIAGLVKGRLLAWDPVKNEQAFVVEHPGPWNGGTLATAGGLLFQGTPAGDLTAYNAKTGEKLWSDHAQTGVVSGPMTYEVDGAQYVAVTVGWGTALSLVAANAVQVPISRVLTFKLGGTAKLPPVTEVIAEFPEPPPLTGTVEQVAHGKQLYLTRCFMCHGDAAMAGGVVPDLRKVPAERHEMWHEVVMDGSMVDLGMPKFDSIFTKEDSDAIQQYVIKRAHDHKKATTGAQVETQ